MRIVLITLLLASIIPCNAQDTSYIDTSLNNNSATSESKPKDFITLVANYNGYQVRFINKPDLRNVWVFPTKKLDDISVLLNSLNNLCPFAFTIKADTIIVDEYFIYNLDSAEAGKPHIAIKYDSSRRCKTLVFQHVSPTIVLDSIFKYLGRNIPIRIKTGEKVSGIIPLKNPAGYLHRIMALHDWTEGKDGKRTFIEPLPIELDDIKNSYSVDSADSPDSSYIIYTTQKKNNKKVITFQHIRLYDLFTIIHNNNGYEIDYNPLFKKVPYISGKLPLEIPMRMFGKLITSKHNLFCGYAEDTVVFVKEKKDLQGESFRSVYFP